MTASNRSLQWRERVITPMFESQTDHAIMLAFAKKFGWDKEFMKNYQMWKPDGDTKWEEPTPESILKEINRANWTIGYTGQSPERLKLHMKNMATFDVKSLRAKGGPCDGDYFGLPWPCYGTPGAQASRFAEPLPDEPQRDGRRRKLPREFRRRARRRQPPGRGRLAVRSVPTLRPDIRNSTTC